MFQAIITTQKGVKCRPVDVTPQSSFVQTTPFCQWQCSRVLREPISSQHSPTIKRNWSGCRQPRPFPLKVTCRLLQSPAIKIPSTAAPLALHEERWSFPTANSTVRPSPLGLLIPHRKSLAGEPTRLRESGKSDVAVSQARSCQPTHSFHQAAPLWSL